MEALARMLPDCSGTSEVMGLEGAAAAAYFPALGELMPPDLRFTTRSRQPPQDLVNSGLSFLYTVLLGECVTALYAAGLAAFGLLHSRRTATRAWRWTCRRSSGRSSLTKWWPRPHDRGAFASNTRERRAVESC